MSSKLPSCLLDWRPSRLLQASLLALGLLAALALSLSALPLAGKLMTVPAALLYAMHLAGREARQVPCALRISADGAVVALVTTAGLRHLSDPRVHVRWPLAMVTGHTDGGARLRLFWWPDTLPVRSRRLLRLASRNPIAASGPGLATMSG